MTLAQLASLDRATKALLPPGARSEGRVEDALIHAARLSPR